MKRTQSQIGKLSRRKGKSFEREIAHFLTDITGLKWETTRNSGRTDLRGDVYCRELNSEPFVVECKHRNEYTLTQLMSNTKSVKNVFKKLEDEGKPYIVFFKDSFGVWVSSSGVKLTLTSLKVKRFCNGMYNFYHIDEVGKIDVNE